jgi:hypothetical protein
LSGNKEYSLVIQGIKPAIVDVGAIHNNNAAGGQIQRTASGNIVAFTVGDGHKAGD